MEKEDTINSKHCVGIDIYIERILNKFNLIASSLVFQDINCTLFKFISSTSVLSFIASYLEFNNLRNDVSSIRVCSYNSLQLQADALSNHKPSRSNHQSIHQLISNNHQLDIDGVNITVTSGDKPVGKGKAKGKSDGVEILSGAKLRLKEGQRYALVGRNGTGKSSKSTIKYLNSI